jgi:UDP-2,3-diacylglucosamine hydrolase
MHRTLFISDLHLQENQPHITQPFLQLLANCDDTVDALYILGDLFETWIGDDDDTPFPRSIIQALKAVTVRGIPIYFMRGNRDFLIDKNFARATGCSLLGDKEKIILYGRPVLLMHGDTLCTLDVKYLAWRKKTHHTALRGIFLHLPLIMRRSIADYLRGKSKQHTQSLQSNMPEIMNVTDAEVVRVLEQSMVRDLIHGHTHRPGIHNFLLTNGEQATRIVLGAWHEQESVLTWYADGRKELKA